MKRPMSASIFLWMSLWMILLFSCSGQDVAGKGSTNETTNGITARLLNNSGTPASGALVKIQSSVQEACGVDSLPNCQDSSYPVINLTADQEGMIHLDSLAAGVWRANSSWNHLGLSIEFSRDTGKVDLGTLVLDSMAQLIGTVPDVTEPILVRIPGTDLWTYTDSAGNFSVPKMYPGSWMVSAHHRDQRTYSGMVHLQGGREGVVEAWLPINPPPPQSSILASIQWNFYPDSRLAGLWDYPQFLHVSVPRNLLPLDYPSGNRSRLVFKDEMGRALPWSEESPSETDSIHYWVHSGPNRGSSGVQIKLDVLRDSMPEPGFGETPLPRLTAPWILAQPTLSQVVIHNQMVQSASANGVLTNDAGWVNQSMQIQDDSCRLSYHLGSIERGSPLAFGGNAGWWMQLDTLLAESILFSRNDESNRNTWKLMIHDVSGRIRLQWQSPLGGNQVISQPVLDSHRWIHLGLTWGNGGVDVFVNGGFVANMPVQFEMPGQSLQERLCVAGGASSTAPKIRGALVDQVMLGIQDMHGGSPWPLWNELLRLNPTLGVQ